MTNLVLGVLLALCFLAAMQYAGYLRSRRSIARVYGALASTWQGEYDAGSFFRPPRVRFAHGSADAVLSSFYLYQGQTGNYTQLSFQLPQSYLQAFVVRPAEAAGYDVDSVRPELVRRLLASDWAEPLARVDSLTGGRGVEVRFDGDTLLIRARGLLLDHGALASFKTDGTAMLDLFCRQLDAPLTAPSS